MTPNSQNRGQGRPAPNAPQRNGQGRPANAPQIIGQGRPASAPGNRGKRLSARARARRNKRIAILAIFLVIIALTLVGVFSLLPKSVKSADEGASGQQTTGDPQESTAPGTTPEQTVPMPVITAPEALESVVVEGKVADLFDPMANVSAADESGKDYPVTVEGTYDLSKAGEYTLTYVAHADDGQKVTKEVKLTVKSPFDAEGSMIDGTYRTFKGYDLVIENGLAYACVKGTGEDGTETVTRYLIVNKSYTVPTGYSSTGDGTRSLQPACEQAWYEMRNAVPANIKSNFKIKSGVRNISDQTSIFNNYVRERGLEEAMTFSAKPRHSEHHTGLAMDITCAGRDEAKLPANAPVMAWLNDNAWQYGFILRYPENKTEETGYVYEQWHYRYVGKELAEILYNNGEGWITMEDYFGLDSVYRD